MAPRAFGAVRHHSSWQSVPGILRLRIRPLLLGYLTLLLAAAPPLPAGDYMPVMWGNQKLDVREFDQPLTQIAAGMYHTVGLKTDGAVVAWGQDGAGQSTVPAGLTGVVAITAGAYHTAALKSDGTIVAWGSNDQGYATVPAGLSGVKAIAAGAYHTVALKTDGTVVAWGKNDRGQTTVPAGLSEVSAIAAGEQHTVALKTDGTVVAWGGSGVPLGLSGVSAIAAGGFHTMVLKTDGTIAIWGQDGYGQATVPEGLSGVSAVAGGYAHTVALKTDGTVVAWGMNWHGQTTVPAGLSGISAIAAGGFHTVALKPDGTVVGWGDNLYGQSLTPTELRSVRAIAAGPLHTVALKTDGTVVTWGDNESGQTTLPVELSGVKAIAAGGHHTVVVKEDGTVMARGDNGFGQSTVPSGVSGVSAVAAGAYHSVALKTDGTVVAWGYNEYGEATVPPGLSGVIAIAAGWFHNLALKADGTVVAWGSSYQGRTTVPAGLSGVTAIAAGSAHSVALKADGTVVAWGDNGAGQSTVPVGLSRVSGIAAGSGHTIALKPEGTVVAWGSNAYGETTVPAGLSGVIEIATGDYHTVALAPLPPELTVFQGAVTGAELTHNTGTQDFGSVLLGDSSAAQSFTIRNDGRGDLTAIAVTKTAAGQPADFTLNTAGMATTLAPGASTTFSVSFAPTFHGARTATLHITSSDADENPFAIALGGMGVGPDIIVEEPAGTPLVNGASRDWGIVSIESNTSLSFTVKNTGNDDLTGITASLTGADARQFRISTAPVSSLEPGDDTVVTVTFAPTRDGDKTATLEIASNDLDDNPFLIQLTGIGRLPQKPVTVDPGPQQHHVGQPVNLPLVASDNPTRFIVTGLPLGLRYDAITRRIVGQPTTPKLDRAKQPVAYQVKISAANRLGIGPVVTVPWMVLPLPVDFTSRFSGLVARQALVNGDLGSSLSLTITASGAASGRVWAGPRLLGYRGRLSVAPGGASAVLNTTIPNLNPLEVVTLELTLADGEVSGRMRRGGGEAGVSGWRGRVAPPLELQGTFHAALEPQATGANIPEGWGWAVLKVSSTGAATWSGRLADGSVLTGSYRLGLAGGVPLFTRFPLGRGSVLGWTELDEFSGNLDDTTGITWLKNSEPPTSKGRIYKNGIPLHTLTLRGGRYGLNTAGLILDFAAVPDNGVVRFSDAGLAEPVAQDFELRTRNTIALPAGAPVKVTLSHVTGRITSRFIMLSGAKTLLVKGSGLLVPRLNQGLGYFLLPQGPLSTDPILSGKLVLEQQPD